MLGAGPSTRRRRAHPVPPSNIPTSPAPSATHTVTAAATVPSVPSSTSTPRPTSTMTNTSTAAAPTSQTATAIPTVTVTMTHRITKTPGNPGTETPPSEEPPARSWTPTGPRKPSATESVSSSPTPTESTVTPLQPLQERPITQPWITVAIGAVLALGLVLVWTPSKLR